MSENRDETVKGENNRSDFENVRGTNGRSNFILDKRDRKAPLKANI
jgi:hypothetical protein